MERYDRAQYGTLMLVLVAAFAGAYALANATDHALAAGAVVVLVVLVAFCRLRTHVDAEGCAWAFTFGFPAGRVAIRDIESAEVTRTNFLEGWGIHWTIWHGWLWNVGGFQAVEIHYAGGKRVTIGTDDPQGLLEAIERFRGGVA